MGQSSQVASSPYAWPYDGNLRPDNTALLVIDVQVDFCGKGGYVDQMGYDLALTQAPIPHIARALAAARAAGWRVVHTREGHRPQLVDLPANKRWRSRNIGAGIGEPGPAGRLLVRGEPGWEIIPELAPLEGEVVVDKPGKGCFYATDLDLILRTCGVRNLVLVGVTTDVCVHTTLRHANDMGYECLLLSDATAATDPANHAAALSMVQKQGGVFGAVATTDQLLEALEVSSPTPGTASPPQPLAPSTPTPALVSLPAGAKPMPPSAGVAGSGAVVAEVSAAKPYAYQLPVAQAALVMIDFQRDFMEPGGFGAALGNDVGLLQACVPAAQVLLAACRAAGMLVVHTKEAHKGDLSDLHPCKLTRGNLPAGQGLRIGEAGPMGRLLIQDEPGNDIIPEVSPVEGELVVFKPGKGAFYATGLEQQLHARGITHLLFAGVTTEVCVQTSMREANDRGFECCLVADASASYIPGFKAAVCDMVVAQGGIVGWVADSSEVAAALAQACAA